MKSYLYSSIWTSCDELRGGMDASQYKDCVLFMLFNKYFYDRYLNFEGMERRREKTRALNQAMMQELFTRKTRLV